MHRSRAVLVVLLSLFATLPSGQARASDPLACDKGPVGWDVFRRLDLLPMIRCGVETKQFSSFNRDGDNGDGSSNWACFRRDPADGCVIAEASGPGEIDSIWFTRDRGNVSNNGRIRIDLDGTRVVDAPLKDVVDGKLGAPFVYPLVANADQSSGGNVIKIPMPFRSSMRVSTDDARYYHVTWRSFADAAGVTTFDPTHPAHDVVALLAAAGTQDPKPIRADTSAAIAFDIPAHGAVTMDAPRGPHMIAELGLRFPTAAAIRPIPQAWEEPPIVAQDVIRDGTGNDYYGNYVPDQTWHALDGFLRDMTLRMSFDGIERVASPLAEFLGSGTGLSNVPTLMFSMSPGLGEWQRVWWPMPYRQEATLELRNGSDQAVSVEVAMDVIEAPEVTDALATGRAAYFSTTSRSEVTTLGRDYLFLDAEHARGHVVGVTHTMYPGPTQDLNHFANGVIRTYLEGDERIYTDRSRTPQLYGTGNEDFYEGGWYYNRSQFTMPLHGNPLHEQSDGCEAGCTGSYRLFIGDAIGFTDRIRMGIEVGGHNDEVRTYSSTTYWYGIGVSPYVPTDVLEIGDLADELGHSYTGTGALSELTATFDGDDDDVNYTDRLRAVTQPESFMLSIDPANRGVYLRRLADQSVGGQAARVTVDGAAVGTWIQPLHNPHHRWREDAFEIPASLTTGKSTIEVTIEPMSAWNAARYEAFSRT